MLRLRRNLERCALLLSTRTGWTRAEILNFPVPDLVRHLNWLKKSA